MEAGQTARLNEARELISESRRHAVYTAREYLAYCAEIRSLTGELDQQRHEILDVVAFFEKKFVEEMEVLGRICSRFFASELDKILVQYVRNDPPDGVISLPDGEQIFIECTLAKDSRWENFVFEQMRLHGRIISLSGFEGSDISGNRVAGYTVNGMNIDDPDVAEYLCEADEGTTVVERHRRHIVDKLDKKLEKDWPSRRNWLSVYVNEFVMIGGCYKIMEPTLSELFELYRQRLRSKHIESLVFISNKIGDDGWISMYRT
jgi:hypothetical protein